MAVANLEALASSTASSLREVWDEIGLPEAERGAFLSGIAAQVVAVYTSAVSAQRARHAQLSAEIEQLQRDITDMQEAMDQAADGLVRAALARATTATQRAATRRA